MRDALSFPGYDSMRNMGGFRLGSDSAGEAALVGGRLKGQISFSARPSSTSALMSQISEMGRESMGGNSPDDGGLRHGNGGSRHYIPGFPVASWEDPSLLSHGFGGPKRPRDPSEPQVGSSHHFLLLPPSMDSGVLRSTPLSVCPWTARMVTPETLSRV